LHDVGQCGGPGKRQAPPKLVFVDCQFWGKEGKMKGSTKSQKMDEPFSS